MSPLTAAFVTLGHLLGAALAVGGAAMLGAAVLPRSDDVTDAERRRQDAGRRRAMLVVLGAIALSLVTGLCKWLPPTGVGWLGHGGLYTGMLHGKIVLSLLLFHLRLGLTRQAKPGRAPAGRGRAPLCVLIGVAIMTLAILHRFRPFEFG